jgi:hypothetical protein
MYVYNKLSSFISRKVEASKGLAVVTRGLAVLEGRQLIAFDPSSLLLCSGEFPCMLYRQIKVDEILEII